MLYCITPKLLHHSPSRFGSDYSLPVRYFLVGAQEVVGGLPLPLASELIEAGAPVRCLLALLTAVSRLQQLRFGGGKGGDWGSWRGGP